MIHVYAEQLASQLKNGLRSRYFIWGNDPLLLQESQERIRQTAIQHGFEEHYAFVLDNHTDWDEIFSVCQSLSLFTSRQTLTLYLPENGPHAAMSEKLTMLATRLHDDILLILRGHRLTKAQENSTWFNALSENSLSISCLTPDMQRLPQWIHFRANSQGLKLDEQAIQLLCYCYEGNLLALSQALERLSLLYPDGNLTLPRLESAVNDAAHFTPYHWIDALLAGKSKRAWHILKQLQLEGTETIILLRAIQRDLILLLTFKQQENTISQKMLFDRYKVWQNRRPLLSTALQRLQLSDLHRAITLLTKMELTIKKDHSQSIWSDLESLSMHLCGHALPKEFISYDYE